MRSKSFLSLAGITALLILIAVVGCERDLNTLASAPFPTNPVVFSEGFTADLDYQAFSGSKVDALSIENKLAYSGEQALSFAVPAEGDPGGAFAGGAFISKVGRDLSGYDALTFWVRASTSATVGLAGMGNDNSGNSKYLASITNFAVNPGWQKYVVPIPDAKKHAVEKGLFQVAAGAVEGNGYQLWFDEIKFEKLGTIAQPRPGILELQDQVIATEIGEILTIGGTHVIYNIAGKDQRVEASPAYFSFVSSDETVATVDEEGKVSALGLGTAIITAKLGTVDAGGSMTVNVGEALPRPTTVAPTPAVDAADVISLFSNAYNNVPIDTWNTGWEFSTAVTQDIQINGDDIKRYTNLNFVGIEFATQTIDATNMNRFHMDIWTPDPTALPVAFKILLVDFGENDVFDGGDDTSHEISITSPTLSSESWISIDVPLSDFVGLTNKGHLAQMVLSGDLSTVYVDNVYLYSGEGDGGGNKPSQPAPVPTINSSDVISLFSNAYNDVVVDTWNTGWEFSTAVVSDLQVAGDDVKLYTGLNFVGIEFSSETIDASSTTFFHMDIWTPNSTTNPAAFKIKLIDFGADGLFGGDDDSEHEVTLTAANTPGMSSKTWVSLDIPMSAFTGLTSREHLAQMVLSGDLNTLYVDNVYFYIGDDTGGGNTPDQPALSPIRNTEDVISVFSNTYNNIDANLNPDWGQSTVFSEISISGNNTLLYTGLDYQGIELGSSQNFSEMKGLHVDVWTANSTELNVYLISPGPEEKAAALTVPTSGWASVDIPLTAFSDGMNISDVIQLKFDGNGDVYLDNIYFYKDSTPSENDASLSDLRVNGSTVSGFSPGTLNYSVKLSEAVVPTVTVTENNSNASSVITPATSVPGTTTILVTAQDGITQQTYTVDFSLRTEGEPWTTSDVIDFETLGFGADWSWNVFENDTNPALEFVANPDPSGENTSATVAKFTALQTGQPFAGTETVHGEIGAFTFTAENATVRIMVYKTVISDVGLKFAENNGEAQPEVKVANTKINEWEELTFDLSGSIGAGITGEIDQIIVFPDFNARAQDNVIYFDNIRFSQN